MTQDQLQAVFNDLETIISKAAPNILTCIGSSNRELIYGLLGVSYNVNPNDIERIAEKLRNDPDLFTRLANIESTHAEWLKNMCDLADDKTEWVRKEQDNNLPHASV